jgi:cell division protein FtsQ
MKNGHPTNERYNPEEDYVNNDGNESWDLEEKQDSEQPHNTVSGRELSQPQMSRLWTVVLSLAIVILFYGLSQNWKQQTSLGRITISGCEILNQDSLLSSLEELKGKRLETVNLEEIENKLLKTGYIREVVATKELPDGLRISIIERKPMAFIILNKKLKVLDEEGIILDYKPERFSRKYLPMISGVKKIEVHESGARQIADKEITRAIELIQVLEESDLARYLIGEINIGEPNRMFARTSEGRAKLIFGDDGRYEELVEKFETFWVKVVAKHGLKRYAYIDFRFKHKVFVKEI